jgi:hypothetical protein
MFGVTMRYVRAVEDTKQMAVAAIKLSGRKMSKYWPVRKTAASAGGCKSLKLNGGAEGVEPRCSSATASFSAMRFTSSWLSCGFD